jgi:acetolactate synthase-1/2/3 large subunit
MMKLSDYVARSLADKGLSHVFMITGGAAMHLNDSLGHEPRLSVVCNHHEQASAMAAEGYARVTDRPAVVSVTSGPGGINALNGVFGAWVDSIPMLIISGQVKRETCLATYGLPGLRQIGDQEADIISMVRGMTKYAVLVTEPETIRYHLDKAVHLATSGRPGPCWLDIPIDVQAGQIDPATLPAYDPAEDDPGYPLERLPTVCRDILRRLQAAERPVILAGKGIRLADARGAFDKVIRKLGIPVATAWTALDLMASDDPLYCGRPGDVGDRAGNFCVQNSDVLLAVGSRLNLRQVSHNWESFARAAYKISVDADPAELNKPTVRLDLPVHCDAKIFLEELDRQMDAAGFAAGRHAGWLAWCKERMIRYPVVLPRHRALKGRFINPYHFVDRLFRHLADDDAVVCGNGAANVITFQAAPLRKGQRLWANTGCASMGYDLPAAIGAAVARAGKRVICLAGDGSLQQNIQELQAVKHHQWPIKIFVLNNDGYLSIRMTQGSYFNRFIGEGPRSGVSFPDVMALAQAYGLPAYRAEGEGFETTIDEALSLPGPVLCEVMLDPDQPFEPKSSAKLLPDGRMISSPLEDMYPFLDKKEFEENLLIPPWRS